MRIAALIAVVGAATYLTRISGFVLGGRSIPRIVDRFLLYVPVAAFASLVTPALGVLGPELVARLAGIAAASIVVLRIGHLWAGLGAGMAAYWAVRLIVS